MEDSDIENDGGWIRLVPGTERFRVTAVEIRVLDYADAEGDWVLRIGVRAGGELDRLRHGRSLLRCTTRGVREHL